MSFTQWEGNDKNLNINFSWKLFEYDVNSYKKKITMVIFVGQFRSGLTDR